ncbi:MAG: FlgD immunoglobulin-like domain containing protein, partial [Candidatus Kapaibacterium sp.]
SDGSLFIPTNETVIYDVEARGLHDTDVVGTLPVGQIYINGRASPYQVGYINGAFVPLAVFELTADNSGIEHISEFLTPPNNIDSQKALATSFAAAIAAIPTGRKVIVATNFQPVLNNVSGSPEVTNAMESLGSANGFDKLAFFGSYVLIGEKGFAKGQAKESFSGEHTAGVSLLDTFITLGTSGTAQTPQTAVATSYGKLRWSPQSTSAKSTILLNVLGIRKKGGSIDTVLVVDASTGTSADLKDNPASFYERLFVRMDFKRDSSSAISPRLNLIELEYDPAPEFAMNDSLISVSPKIVLEGNSVTTTYQVQNVTCVDARNVPVQLLQIFHGTTKVIATDTIANFPGHSTVSFTHTLPTTGFQGMVSLIATVNPGGVMNEQLSFNNSAQAVYTVVRDSTKPKLDLLFDGNHINSGDYVSSKVVIEIRLSDNSPLRVADSASVSGVLQALFGTASPEVFAGNKITAGFTTKFITQPSGAIQAILDIIPDSALKPGRYLFTAMGNDASGNRADTISDEFVVSGTNGLDHVMNYPNPFKDKTWFTFILKSASQADVKVVIYTVAGRKIRTLHLDPSHQRAGLNSVEWDGRDEMGNDVANGTYLYRVVLNGTNDDGSPSSDATTERAVRSR